jgi:hypothetical protein
VPGAALSGPAFLAAFEPFADPGFAHQLTRSTLTAMPRQGQTP